MRGSDPHLRIGLDGVESAVGAGADPRIVDLTEDGDFPFNGLVHFQALFRPRIVTAMCVVVQFTIALAATDRIFVHVTDALSTGIAGNVTAERIAAHGGFHVVVDVLEFQFHCVFVLQACKRRSLRGSGIVPVSSIVNSIAPDEGCVKYKKLVSI